VLLMCCLCVAYVLLMCLQVEVGDQLVGVNGDECIGMVWFSV
jgi:hypothetical protein